MRFEGTVTSWNEGRGFGFIEPAQGGQAIFIHVSALPARAKQSPLHQRISFEVDLNSQGKKRASHVQLVQAVRPRHKPQEHRPAQRGGVAWYAIPVFALLYLVVALNRSVPHGVALAYAAMSLLCFMAYALDKSAARSGRWRIRETTLLMLGLLCGWPGAVLAQQLLRHKTTKPSFQIAFWVTVLLNVVGFLALSARQ